MNNENIISVCIIQCLIFKYVPWTDATNQQVGTYKQASLKKSCSFMQYVLKLAWNLLFIQYFCQIFGITLQSMTSRQKCFPFRINSIIPAFYDFVSGMLFLKQKSKIISTSLLYAHLLQERHSVVVDTTPKEFWGPICWSFHRENKSSYNLHNNVANGTIFVTFLFMLLSTVISTD